MSNYNIQIVGSANLKQPIGEFEKMQAMVGKTNEQMRLLVMQSGKMNQAAAYGAMTKGVQANSRAYRDAAAASGLFRAEQVRVNTASEDYTKALQKQKLSFRDIIKSQAVAKRAYQEQIALQNMVARQLPTTVGGKTLVDTARPEISALSKDLDTARMRMAWFNAQLKSGAASLVNWGKNTQWAGRQLMVGLTIPIGAFAAATGKMAYDVEQNMVRVQKVYNTTANQFSKDSTEQAQAQRELAQLRTDSFQMATNAAKQYGASLKDTLDVEANLAAAGFQGNNLLASTTDVVKNATLGEIDYQTAMKATIAMQQTMGYSTKQTADMWAYMNSVENSTSLSMADFAKAIPVALGPIKTMGGDVKTLGTLLTGMIERGVQVGKASNAIKAAMQRLYRPSKSVADEWERLTNTNIGNIVDRNKGNIMGILTDIEKVTEGLDRVSKNKALAGLFGSYQVGNYIAMLDSIKGINEGLGQASTAFDIANQHASKWRQVQQGELNQWRKSVAGQFKVALETLKAGLVSMGEPFLAMGTQVLTFLAKMVTAFNNLPSSAKKAFAITAILTAIAGPIIMLTGLLANLVGNVIRAGASFAGLFVKMDILDKNSAATKLITELTTTAFDKQASAAQKNAEMINALTEALLEAEAAQRKVTLGAMQAANQTIPPGALGGSFAGLPAPSTTGRLRGDTKMRMVGGVPTFETTAVPGRAGMVPIVPPGTNGLNIVPKETAQNAEATAKSTEKISGGMHAAAVSGGVFAAAMAASMVSSNKTVDEVAQLTMVASILAPAMLSIWSLVKVVEWQNAIGSASGFFIERWTAVKAAVVTANVEIAASQTLTQAMGTAAMGIGEAFTAALGPVGLLIAAIAAAALGIKKLKDSADSAGEAYNNMYNNAKPLASIYGYDYKEQGQLNVKSPSQAGTAQVTSADRVRKVANAYSGVIDKIKEATTEQEKYNEASRLGMEVINSGGTVSEAKKVMKDALTAAQGVSNANKIMFDFSYKETQVKWVARNALTSARTALQDAFNERDNKSWTNRLWGNLLGKGSFTSLTEVDTSHTFISDASKADLIAQAKDLKSALDSAMQGGGDSSGFLKSVSQDLGAIDDKIMKSSGDQKAMWEDMRKQYILAQGAAFGLTDRFKALPDSVLQTIDAVGLLKKLMITFPKGVTEGWMPTTDAKNMAAYILAAVGHANNLGSNMNNVSGATGEAANKAREFAQALQAAKSVDLGGMMKDTMGGIEKGISDATTRQFTSQMNSALDKVKSAGQARIDAFDAHAQAAQNAQDARFKKREAAVSASYDNRIKAIQKEIDAEKKADDIRQKIFDAEQARIDQMNNDANQNIDFNIALNSGNFDEAARIRNNQQASDAQFQLQKQLDAASSRSQNKQDRQSKRIDTLDAEKSKALDNLRTMEDKEKASLQRSQERKRKALDAEVKANDAAAKKMWDDRKKYLDKALKDFTGYTATSSRDLLDHIKAWQQKYGEFDLATGKMFNLTVDDITKYLRKQISQSRDQIMNDALWSTAGNRIATKMIRGAFGMSKDDFFSWLAGKGPGPSAGGNGGAAKGKSTNDTIHGPGGYTVPTFHSGGLISEIGSGRGNRPRNAPLGSDELPILAQRGEFMINKDARKVYGTAAMEAVNAGKATILTQDGWLNSSKSKAYITKIDPKANRNIEKSNLELGARDATGTTGLMAAAFATIMKNVVKYRVQQAAEAATVRDASSAQGILGAILGSNIGAGKYGDTFLNSAQVHNAEIIASVGQGMGMSRRDIEVGLMAALQESSLINNPGGDRDSAGLFQMRPSAGWGTYAEVTNPNYAAKKFFSVLKGVGNRNNMSMGAAAQAVERSAYPGAYTKWENEAAALVAAMSRGGGGGTAGDVSSAGANSIGKRAIAWATNQIGHAGWYYMCQSFVRHALGAPGGAATAIQAWDQARYKHHITDPRKVPAGVPVFWSGGAGHTALSTGGGNVISTDYPRSGYVGRGTISGITSQWHKPLMGWTEDDNGKRVWGIPGLRVGGTIKHDNTIANLHKGEKVLTAPLSKELENGIGSLQNLDDAAAALTDLMRSGAPVAQDLQKESGAAGTASIGSYNVHVTSANAGTAGDLADIIKKVDILSLQEYTEHKRGLDSFWAQHGWKLLAQPGPTHQGNSAAIAYNPEKYDASKFHFTKMNNPGPPGSKYGGHAYPAAYFPTALMTGKNGGGKFWFTAVHTIAHASHLAKAIPIRLAQYARLVEMNKQLQATGIPSIMAGDFNLSGKSASWFEHMIKETTDFKGLDHIIYDPKFIQNLGHTTINQGMTSDHPFVMGKYKISANSGVPAFMEGGFTRTSGLAMLHPRETVLSEPLSDKLRTGLDRLVANESNNHYNLNMVFHGDVNDREDLAKFVMTTIKRAEDRKPQPRSR